MAAAYTRVQLGEVEDSAPAFGLGGAQEMRFARDALDAQDTGMTLHRLRPHARPGLGHRHVRAEEIFVVLAGSGRVKLDDEVLDLGPYDAIRVSPSVIRAFEAGPNGLDLLAVGPHVAGDGDVFPGWWTA